MSGPSQLSVAVVGSGNLGDEWCLGSFQELVDPPDRLDEVLGQLRMGSVAHQDKGSDPGFD